MLLYFFFFFVITICSGKECIFLHGAGQPSFQPSTSTFPQYWGNLDQQTPQCSSRVFIHANTRDFEFDTEVLMSYYCKVAVTGALGMKYGIEKAMRLVNSSGLIKDKIVFTHSMGNNIIAAAIKHGVCDLDSTSSWYSISGPFHGSKAADYLAKECSTNTTFEWILTEFGLCNKGNVTGANYSLRDTYPGLVGLADIVKDKANGMLCGTSAFGKLSKYSIPLNTLSELVNYGEPNDGMVPYSSCAIFGTFSTDPKSNFFTGAYNHADSTCRTGSSTVCSWYSYRT